MTAGSVTRCEVYMSIEEQKMLNKVIEWIEDMGDETDQMPEYVQGLINTIYEGIGQLLDLIPEEH